MKLNTLFSLLLTGFVLHSTASLAKDTDLIALKLTVTENSQIKTMATVTTMNGQLAPFKQTKVTPYRASSYRKGNEKAVIEMDSIETGVVAFFTPEIQSNGEIKTKLTIDISELDSMEPVTSDGLTLDAPSTSNVHMDKVLTLKPGEAVTQKMGKYAVTISASRQ